MKEIPEPVFSCLINHSLRGTKQQHWPQPASQRQELNSLQVSFLPHSPGSWKMKQLQWRWFVVRFWASLLDTRGDVVCLPLLQFNIGMREQSKGLGTISQILRWWSATLHWRSGVTHNGVVVWWRAVTLQACIQGRVIQTEVQRWEFLLLWVAQHRLFTLTHCLHPEKHRDRKWWEQGNITAINLLSRIAKNLRWYWEKLWRYLSTLTTSYRQLNKRETV